ncbi:MAG: hypothetical protein ABJL99_18065 [Aliishimia sp.]
MRIRAAIFAGLGLAIMGALPASAEGPKIYPVNTGHNYCPAGLQPVSMDGTICCGVPNQGYSYQSVMSHPVKKIHKVRKVRHVRAVDCPIGEKGCR